MCPSARGNYVLRASQCCQMAEKNKEDKGKPERGSSTKKETLCRERMGNKTELHVQDTIHTFLPHQEVRGAAEQKVGGCVFSQE